MTKLMIVQLLFHFEISNNCKIYQFFPSQKKKHVHRIYLPPLHIKLGLLKKFVKALEKKSSEFAYLAEKLPSLSQAKIKEGVVIHRSPDSKNCA